MATVFISYRYEDAAQGQRVRALAERLEQAGLTVVLDQLAQERQFHGGGPDEGWSSWSRNQAGNAAHKVLVIASGGWFRCYEKRELAGRGLGAAAEAAVIDQRLYNAAGINPDIRVVTLGPIDPFSIPLALQPYHHFDAEADVGDLIRWLTAGAPAAIPTADWPDQPPNLVWPLANHSGVCEAFARLLTRGAPWRFLPVRGPSETGKSEMTRQMLRNALRLPGLACGRLDFKGTTNVDAELRAFIRNLGVPPPSTGQALNAQLSHVLSALIQRNRPALLIFDTYEAAGEAHDWVEKELLPHLIRAAWLRVVIAGQDVPASPFALWADRMCPPLQLAQPLAEDWFAFSQLHKPAVALDIVRQVHQLCAGKPSVLVVLLGPSH